MCAVDRPITCGGRLLRPGRFALVPANAAATLAPADGTATVLRALLGAP